MIIDLLFIFFSSFASLFIIRKFAKKVGLVDTPNLRKKHLGAIPTAGGIAICITLANILYTRPYLVPNSHLLLSSIIILTIIGSLDDKFDLNVSFRLLAQITLSCMFIHVSDFQLDYLGNLFGFGEITFDSVVAYTMTIIAILGVINAFNMIDGLDGLLGTLSAITFASLSVLFHFYGLNDLSYFCIILVVCILPYICMNLGYLGRKRKVFMGDAGSMMLGFIAVWLLLNASQSDVEKSIKPVTVLWLVALPIMDMTATIIRRLLRKQSAFHSDQDHIHYILQNLGVSSTQTLFIICGLSCLFSLIGVLGEIIDLPDPMMFYSFFSCFIIYFWALHYLKRQYSQPEGTI